MTAKLIERCPLKYPLVTYFSSLNPPKMISSPSDVIAKLSIREAERKTSKVDTSINILGKEADDLAKSAEAKHDFILLTKSNALRLKIAQQSQEIPKLEKELKELKEKLKSLE